MGMDSNKEIYTLDYLKENTLLEPSIFELEPLQNEKKVFNLREIRSSMVCKLIALEDKPFDSEAKADLTGNFKLYCDEAKKKKIVLHKKSDVDVHLAVKYHGIDKVSRWQDSMEFLILDYKTRFTHDIYRWKASQKYNDYWDDMENARVNKAVFVTLTVDPKRIGNRYLAVSEMSRNYNKFRSAVNSYHGRKVDAIAVPEYTKDGWIHLHCVFFDVGFLMPHEKITALWKKYGVGEINYEYTIHYRNNEWVWGKSKKKQPGKFGSARSYLKKYLNKAFKKHEDPEKQAVNDLHSALLWATNKRFFSCRITNVNKVPKGLDLINAEETNSNFEISKAVSLWEMFMIFSSRAEIPSDILMLSEPH
jgi:hypothetical protein